MRRHTKAKVIVAVLTAIPGAIASAWADGITERVSVGVGGVAHNGFFAESDAISADGRFVPFDSDGSNLVAGDTNNSTDVFIRDRLNGTTAMLSRGRGGGGNSISYGPRISADGRFVSFVSLATDLVPGGANGQQQAYVYDQKTGKLILVSVSKNGAQSDGGVFTPSISSDGRYLIYSSFSTNLVPNDTNGTLDAFVYDQKTGNTSRVSVGVGGKEVCDLGASNGGISADGRFVGINTGCRNMVPGKINEQIHTLEAYVYDRQNGRNDLVSIGPNGDPANDFSLAISISPDGRYVGMLSYATNLVPGGTNGQSQVYVPDRRLGINELVSVGPGGLQGNGFSSGGEMSADGQFVAFSSEATNLFPCPWRHQRRVGHLRPRPAERCDAAGQHRAEPDSRLTAEVSFRG